MYIIMSYIIRLCYLPCGIQDVDQYAIIVNLRMNIHRRGKSCCEISMNCFENACRGNKFSIQILEKQWGNYHRNEIAVTHLIENYFFSFGSIALKHKLFVIFV